MKMSTKGRYGLRVMMELALRYGSGPILVSVLADNQGISANYIHVLMGGLKSAGLVRSLRGPNGGYELARDPSAITALEIVTALEGDTAPADCVSNPGCCERSEQCVTRDLWSRIASATDEILHSQTLAQLAEGHLEQEQPFTYSI